MPPFGSSTRLFAAQNFEGASLLRTQGANLQIQTAERLKAIRDRFAAVLQAIRQREEQKSSDRKANQKKRQGLVAQGVGAVVGAAVGGPVLGAGLAGAVTGAQAGAGLAESFLEGDIAGGLGQLVPNPLHRGTGSSGGLLQNSPRFRLPVPTAVPGRL